MLFRSNKLSTVKRKQADPRFAQQQQQPQRQQQQQGGSNSSGSRVGPTAVAAETLLPKAREAATAVRAKRRTLIVSAPRMLNSPPTSTMRTDRFPLLTRTLWPIPLA